MKLYIANGIYYGTQDAARKAAKAAGTGFRAEEVPTRQADLIEYLNALVTAPAVEVAGPSEVTIAPVVTATAPNGSYAVQSVAIEDLWDDLPLSVQLHYGALALENARTVLPQLQHAADTASVL